MNLLVAPRYLGDELSQIFADSPERKNNAITVNIGNIVNIEPDDPMFDPSDLFYFGQGTISEC